MFLTSRYAEQQSRNTLSFFSHTHRLTLVSSSRVCKNRYVRTNLLCSVSALRTTTRIECLQFLGYQQERLLFFGAFPLEFVVPVTDLSKPMAQAESRTSAKSRKKVVFFCFHRRWFGLNLGVKTSFQLNFLLIFGRTPLDFSYRITC